MPVKLVLYDLTSVYFEGKGPNGMARYGHSRDHRSDRSQILLAVATDEEGIPIHVEVLRGNRADNTTLCGLLATLKRRFKIQTATFVFDGGMSSQLNLDTMTKQSLKFVTRLSSSTLCALLKDAQVDMQMEFSDIPSVMEVKHEGKRYVIAGGKWRQQRDKVRRESRIAKGEALLIKLADTQRRQVNSQKLASQVGRALEKVKAHKYFSYHVNANGVLEWARKNDVIKQETAIDGLYLLHTNAEKLTAEETLSCYKGLLEVEDAFREVKNYLEVRPIFHYRPDRVRNHVRLCFIAYWISARLGKEWRIRNEHSEVPLILRRLQKIRVGLLQTNGMAVNTTLTKIPKSLNDLLIKTGLLHLFSSPPAWVKVL